MTLETGYLTGQLGAGGYQAQHRGLPRYVGQRTTPNYEKKEGERFGPFVPAPYLPSARLEPVNYDHFVITSHQPVAIDSRGYAVPAGLKIALALGGANGPQYTEADIIAGVKNAAGVTPVVGERVIASMITEGITIGAVIGVASYDVYMQLNSDPHNPGTYQFHNYNRQNSFAILTNYLLEHPVQGAGGVKFPGMAVWKGAVKPGDLVTYDIESKLVAFDASTLVGGDAKDAFDAQNEILGVVTAVETQFPKQLLDQVKTAFDPRLYTPTVSPDTGEFTDGSGLDAMPGSATDGVPHAVQYAGGNLSSGMVTWKLKL